MTGPALPLRTALPLVALGGAAGALSRLGVTEVVAAPWGTLAVNLTGCLLIGLLVGTRRHDAVLRALLGTGFLGGLTTMSAAAVDVHEQSAGLALAYAAASVIGGLALARAGLRVAQR